MRREIASDVLLLRSYEPSFAPLLLEAVQTSCSPDFTRFAPWCTPAYDSAASEQFITDSMADWEACTAYNWALFARKTGEFCGGIGLNQFNQVHGFCNLGYWVRTSYQGQGLAAQATQLLASAAFADLPGLHRLELIIHPDNLPSQRTAIRAGAAYEGLLRQRLVLGHTPHDALMFSLVRPEGI